MSSFLHSAGGWRRQHVRPAPGCGGTVRGRSSSARGQPDPEIERARLTERAKFAQSIDIELKVACRTDAASRHELGVAARELIRRRGYRRLGFVRLSDYARERLGVSARTLHSAAWVASRLDALPIVATAFDRSDLSWAQVRAVCRAAHPDDQEQWLARARDSTVARLEKAAAASRRKEAGVDDPDADDGTIDGEPAIQWRIACPARVRALWRRALELAARAAGEHLSTWRAAEIIAAEALSGRPAGVPVVERVVLACLRLVGRDRRSAAATTPFPVVDGAASVPAVGDGAIGGGTERDNGTDRAAEATIAPDPCASDPFALDARLVAAIRALQTSEPRIGRLLRIVVEQHVYRAHGFTSLAAYVRERLGISVRKAWALLKVERSTRRGDHFARAYDTGAISWVCALTLLPVVDRENAAAWLSRADAVTVRRLADEVNWVLERRDLCGASVSLDPPPLDSVLLSVMAMNAPASTTRVQIGAHAGLENLVTKFATERRRTGEVCDAEIQVTAPASVVALVREALDAFAAPGAPRWSALERVLQHVITYWEATPRHRDPIFARDGWRCAVPGCSSRRNLHDHHLQYRSRGGGNERENRVTVCASHHLHGIHAGSVRAWGTAPRAVRWQLGVRQTGPPLLAYVGDRRCGNESAEDVQETEKITG